MCVAVIVAVAAGVVRIGADAFDMVVVADLGRAEVALMADDLLAILAELAVHAVVAFGNLGDPREEGVHHQRVVVEVGGLAEGDARMGAARRRPRRRRCAAPARR